MSGYADRIIRREYPELGEKIFVEYRNPKTVSADMLAPNDSNNLTHRQVSYLVIAKLLRNWFVYDASSDDDEPPQLDAPATPEMVGLMPFVIVRDVMDDIAEAMQGPR
jgi:hypothetical protein